MAFLRILNGPLRWTRVPVPDEGLVIGRGGASDLRLEDAWISREHLRIEAVAGAWRLRDLGSENGSLLNGVAVREAAIAAGDRIRVGATELRFFDDPPPLRPEPETLVDRLKERIADLEDQNRRLRRLAAEAGVRQARPRGARRGPRHAPDAKTRAFRLAAEPPRHLSLGRRGTRLLRALRDFGVEDVGPCELAPPGPATPEDGRTPGERLLLRLDEDRAPRGWLFTSSRALEIWVPDPESEVSVAEPGRRGPMMILVRDEGSMGSVLPWIDWAARAGLGPFYVGTPVTEPRGGGVPGDGELALAALLVELGIEEGPASLLLEPPPETIHVLGGAARADGGDPEGLWREAAGPGRIQRGLGAIALPAVSARLTLGADLPPEVAEAHETFVCAGLFPEEAQRLRLRVDEGKGVSLAAIFRHPFEARL